MNRSQHRKHNVQGTETPQSLQGPGFKFEPQEMVRWYDPRQLVGTGLQAVLSSVFGSYADKREVQPNVGGPDKSYDFFQVPASENCLEGQAAVWVDYMADTGDGFDATYGMAYLLAQPTLNLHGAEAPKEGVPSKRGDLLIMGGDLVYPAGSREEYLNRFQGPFESAFPHAKSPAERPRIFAIPGNHDWYDGLTSFLRLFCQRRTIGGWQTEQNRSYFAIKLNQNWRPEDRKENLEAHNLWLWGIDIQLDSDIDSPQLAYFRHIAFEKMRDGDQVILCTAEPSWVLKEQFPEGNSYDRLEFFKDRFIRKVVERSPLAKEKGAGRVKLRQLDLVAVLTGDMHHYARYEGIPEGEDRPLHLITSGGGGAFLHPTHNLPPTLDLRKSKSAEAAPPSQETKAVYTQKAIFPSKKESRGLVLRNLLFPYKNPWFSFFFAVFYTLFAWILQSSSANLFGLGENTLLSQITRQGVSFSKVVEVFWNTVLYSPTALLLSVILFGALILFADRRNRSSKMMWGIGFLHGALHVLLAFFWIFIASYLNVHNSLMPLEVSSFPFIVAFTLEMFVIGGVGGGMTIGIYLLLTNLLLKVHDNESFSALRVKDYKNFLRMKVTGDTLTIYPMGVYRVPRKWKMNKSAHGEQSRIEPVDVPDFKERAWMIEAPIVLDLTCPARHA